LDKTAKVTDRPTQRQSLQKWCLWSRRPWLLDSATLAHCCGLRLCQECVRVTVLLGCRNLLKNSPPTYQIPHRQYPARFVACSHQPPPPKAIPITHKTPKLFWHEGGHAADQVLIASRRTGFHFRLGYVHPHPRMQWHMQGQANSRITRKRVLRQTNKLAETTKSPLRPKGNPPSLPSECRASADEAAQGLLAAPCGSSVPESAANGVGETAVVGVGGSAVAGSQSLPVLRTSPPSSESESGSSAHENVLTGASPTPAANPSSRPTDAATATFA
jgi:hypothetical protein